MVESLSSSEFYNLFSSSDSSLVLIIFAIAYILKHFYLFYFYFIYICFILFIFFKFLKLNITIVYIHLIALIVHNGLWLWLIVQNMRLKYLFDLMNQTLT